MKQIFIIASLFFATISWATIIHVPNDYPTIQLAVNNSTQGDTIIIADGIYTELVQNFAHSYNIVIMSENGPENCIFDSEWNAGFQNFNTSFPSTVFEGFTFKGGAYIHAEGYTIIKNCIFKDNDSNNCSIRVIE